MSDSEMDEHADGSGSLPSFKAAWSSIDQAREPGYFVRFMERLQDDASDTSQGNVQCTELLHLQLGQQALDVGCGLGGTVRAIARLVGPNGLAMGVDKSATMIEAARQRSDGLQPRVAFKVADAHHLPFADGTFDAGCSTGTLEVVDNPQQALGELVRVTKTGGRVVVTAPDMGSVLVDATDRALTRRILDFICDHETNGWIGRQLTGLCHDLGLLDIIVVPSTWVVTDFVLANEVWLGRHLSRAQAIGVVSSFEAEAWCADLARRNAAGRFFLARTAFLVAGTKR